MNNATLPAAGLPPSFKSRIAERIAGSQNLLARWRSGPDLELYYEAGDPHSQLCAALARRLLPRLGTLLRIRLVPTPNAETYPEEARQRAFAATDAARLAPCHGLPVPRMLTPVQIAQLQARLAAAGDGAEFLAAEEAALRELDDGRPISGPVADSGSLQKLLQANAARRRQLAHYLPAMWQYHGEWFWALDRLEFLRARLKADGVLGDSAPLSTLDASRLPEAPVAPGTPLEFWYSFRSPYSYLAAVELLRRRATGHGTELRVRPVLPMVMRGLPVPSIKRLYIVRDVKRCADAQGIPFGRIHDPVGDPASRLLTVFPLEADVDTQLRYCAIAGQSVWAEGLDAGRDDVLRSIYERCRLDWAPAAAKLARGIDTQYAQDNRDALFAAGLWGVPSFRAGDFNTWGQDRLWMVEKVTGA
ncbi:DsbA family protein [Solimonas sp. SE-A11]|uniref:DsbA family protein n=1 Tax=Solimonas sp. SE-A11 TaxID=3054954 RepID=UPI00259D3175|nr:DsbA family protein [Solimonas sp. SE-A11]MDM4768972.1 DsbA family protein [Solimonas sp. SE-A11]